MVFEGLNRLALLRNNIYARARGSQRLGGLDELALFEAVAHYHGYPFLFQLVHAVGIPAVPGGETRAD